MDPGEIPRTEPVRHPEMAFRRERKGEDFQFDRNFGPAISGGDGCLSGIAARLGVERNKDRKPDPLRFPRVQGKFGLFP